MVDSGWKAQNYNMKIRVSEQSVQKLRAGGSFQANVASAKKNGTSVQGREAMNRFYGKARVSSALGNSLGKTAVGKAKPPTAQHHTGGNTKPAGNPTIAKTPSIPKARGNSFATGTGNFIKNELLGVDDFSKLRGEMKQHRFGAMAKSLLAGSLELGTTALTVAAAVPTMGGSIGINASRIAAKQVGKQAIKKVAKAGTKEGLKKIGAKAATGTVRGGVKAIVKAPGAPKRAFSAAVKANNPAIKRATSTAATAAKATEDMKKASAAYKTLKPAAGGKTIKGLGAAYDAKKAAVVTARVARAEASRAGARVAAQAAKKAAAKAGKKVVRKGAKRAQGAHIAVASMSRVGK